MSKYFIPVAVAGAFVAVCLYGASWTLKHRPVRAMLAPPATIPETAAYLAAYSEPLERIDGFYVVASRCLPDADGITCVRCLRSNDRLLGFADAHCSRKGCVAPILSSTREQLHLDETSMGWCEQRVDDPLKRGLTP